MAAEYNYMDYNTYPDYKTYSDYKTYPDYNYTYYRDLPQYFCSDGLLLPFFATAPRLEWTVLYFAALLYCFLGMAIIADTFMGSIERITSMTRKVYLTTTRDNEPVIKVRFWSNTVANLTLMALGASAPEILLPTLECLALNFEAGDLGLSTIIGSAAFKFLALTGVCVMSIPNGEIRRIKDIKVFSVTALFSVLAYLWFVVILMLTSTAVIELWEAIITFLFYPLLVIVAWLAEKFFHAPHKVESSIQIELGNFQPSTMGKFIAKQQYFHNGQLDHKGLVAFIKEVKKFPGLTDEDTAVLAAMKLFDSQSHSRMWYRVDAVRFMMGGKRLKPQLSPKLKEVYTAINEHPHATTPGDLPEVNSPQHAIVNFHAAFCAVMEDKRKFQVTLCRTGRTDNTDKVRVESADGTATVSKDYLKINEIVTFMPGEVEKHITAEVINDNQWGPDEQLFLKLTLLLDEKEHQNIQLGHISVMEIIILTDGEPGVVMFTKPGFHVKESTEKAIIPVIRKKGADGNISVKWRTINKTATDGKDFKGGEGVIEFKHTEIERNIEIPIINDTTPKTDEYFEIELFDAEGGVKIGQINQTSVTITRDDDFNSLLSRMVVLINANMDAMKAYHKSYVDQIKAACKVKGGDTKNASTVDFIMHIITFGWKVIFSLVPPAGILGGWLCFFVSLACITVLTAIILDLAHFFGCQTGLRDILTGIIFVSLGLSLPDIFALKTAAVQEKYADNAVGSVTGSNAVNLFLGLGISSVMSSIYQNVQGNVFYMILGSHALSTGLFTALCIVCIIILFLRRNLGVFGKAELGGPSIVKYVTGTVMISLWVTYVLLVSLEAYAMF